MLQDLLFGFRVLRRSAGFTVLAVMCLTIGHGTPELALRLARGTDAADLRRFVFSKGVILSGTALAIGVGAALPLTRSWDTSGMTSARAIQSSSRARSR